MPSVASLSVIIPAFNAQSTIGQAIESIRESVSVAARIRPIAAEIIVVDDASEDGTAEAAARTRPAEADLIVKRCRENRGPGSARNAGVRLSRAEFLFFLDADDMFLPNHILVCLNALLPDRKRGWAQTRMQLPSFAHPTWQENIMGSSTINRCVRRRAHELVGGFPEQDVFRRASEDLFYSILLKRFLPGLKVQDETVVYNVRPGNFLDRRRDVLSRPQHPKDTGMSDEDWVTGDRLLKERIRAVKAKLGRQSSRTR